MIDHYEAQRITGKEMAVVNRRVRSMQNTYDTLAHKMNNLTRNARTQPLIDEFNSINLKGLVTLEQCDAVQNILEHLSQNIDSVLALNPYLVDVHSKMTRRKTLGDIQLDQNGTTIRLSDFLTIKGVSRDAREDTIKRYLNDWLYEANEMLNRKVQMAEMNLSSIRKSKLRLPFLSFFRLTAVIVFVVVIGAVFFLPEFAAWRTGTQTTGNLRFVSVVIYLSTLAMAVSSLMATHAANFPLQFTKLYERELKNAKKAKDLLLSRREKLERLLLRKARSGGKVNDSLRSFTILSATMASDGKAKQYLFRESIYYKKRFGLWVALSNLLVIITLAATGLLTFLVFFSA